MPDCGMRNIVFKACVLSIAALLTGCASPAFQAYNATPIFGKSREVLKDRSDFAYRFTFRGGTVTYRPDQGAQWFPKGGRSRGETFSGGHSSAALPNGCLVYACARAEQIRLRPAKGESRSQVVGYKRSDGSGHAFVLFEKEGIPLAEDNSGTRAVMPHPLGRSSAEALCMATLFQRRARLGGSEPVQASFVGRY
jgi:hypothetical protein